jgi:hypothetical protein
VPAFQGLFDHDDGGQILEGWPSLWQREVGAAGARGGSNPLPQAIYSLQLKLDPEQAMQL